MKAMTPATSAPGLKTVLREVASVYGMDVARFYEVQRDLTTRGLLPRRKGRGPGSGVEFTIENLAIVLAIAFSNIAPIEMAAVMRAALDFAIAREGQEKRGAVRP